MSADAWLERDRSQPLDPWFESATAPEAWPELLCHHFEFSSRGDRVPGRLWRPQGAAGPTPLVLLQHGAGGSHNADYLDAAAGPWVERGAAVASIDFPLHGARQNAKLTPQLLGVLSGRSSPTDLPLWREFIRQSVWDLQGALDALETLGEFDAKRVVYAAFSMGSLLGTIFSAIDARPRAAALALAGGGFGPPELDPATYIGRIAPRPLLFVNAHNDERIPRTATEKLYKAAGDPKEIVWFEGGHGGLRGRALKAMWGFLEPELGL